MTCNLSLQVLTYEAPRIFDAIECSCIRLSKLIEQFLRPSELAQMAHQEKVDVHSHFLPRFYRQACLDNGHGKPDGMPALPVLYFHQQMLKCDTLTV
jgi:hypothetical protein